jgi:hypothetical protein
MIAQARAIVPGIESRAILDLFDRIQISNKMSRPGAALALGRDQHVQVRDG